MKDAQHVAPPFSCGPCVTRVCIQGVKNSSAAVLERAKDVSVLGNVRSLATSAVSAAAAAAGAAAGVASL